MTANSGAGVPLCDLQAQYRELRPQLESALARVLASGQVILGPEVAALENEVAGYCGVAHGVGCGSGTDALSLALHALDIGNGDEVILPAFTFFATAGGKAPPNFGSYLPWNLTEECRKQWCWKEEEVVATDTS